MGSRPLVIPKLPVDRVQQFLGKSLALQVVRGSEQTAVPLLLGAPGVGKSESSRRALVHAVRILAKAVLASLDPGDVSAEAGSDAAEALAQEASSAAAPALKLSKKRAKELLRALASTYKLAKKMPELADPETPFAVHYRPDVPAEEYEGKIVWVNINVSSSPLLKLAGLPYVDDSLTKTYPPEWAVVARRAFIAVVNIDEVTNEMDPERTSLLYSLTLSKTVGDYKFGHQGVFVVGTGNTADVSSLVAYLPGPLVAGRFAQIEVLPPSVADWIEYMDSVYGHRWYRPVAVALTLLAGGEDVGRAVESILGPKKSSERGKAIAKAVADIVLSLRSRLCDGFPDPFMPPAGVLNSFSEVVPGETPSFPTPRGWTSVAVQLYQLSEVGRLTPETARAVLASTVGMPSMSILLTGGMEIGEGRVPSDWKGLAEFIEREDRKFALGKAEKVLDSVLAVAVGLVRILAKATSLAAKIAGVSELGYLRYEIEQRGIEGPLSAMVEFMLAQLGVEPLAPEEQEVEERPVRVRRARKRRLCRL